MKHLAVRSMSVRNPANAFSTPGLGDRIHSALVGWTYGQAHGVPVTLHLTHDKGTGGQYGNKSDSWREVVELFPAGSLEVCHHPVTLLREAEWLAYLRSKGYEAEGWWYSDHPGPHEPPVALDIAPYLRRIPLLTAEPADIGLPERFFTVQWDSNERKRTLSVQQRAAVVDRYRAAGYGSVIVGGEAPDKRLRWSLKHIAWAMSRAAFHVGVDSAFAHMAQLYMPWERIHLYNEADGFYSHHARRARDNGATINLHL